MHRSFGDTDVTTFFTMHDVVHDLARSVMGDEILLAGNDGNIGGNRCHYALLNDCCKPLESRRIRALRFMGSAEILLDDAAIAYAKSLRVLDLSGCSIHELTDSIGRMKQLRYLNAPRVQHEVIPDSITRLSKLLYLSLRESSLSTLPESIGEMVGLMYLDLSGCERIEELPKSFGKLKKLVHLDLSKCSALENILCGGSVRFELFSFSALRELIGEMGGLSSLSALPESIGEMGGLSSLSPLPESIGEMGDLMYLDLSGCKRIKELPKSFGKLKKLVHLDLSECSALENISKFMWSFMDLQYLNLSCCHCIGSLPESLGGLTSLQYLNLKQCLRKGENDSFLDSISALSNLEHLDLSDNFGIISLPESLCNLRKLHTLDLSYCINIQKIPESICRIDSLKSLYFRGCYGLDEEPVPQPSTSFVSLPLFKVHVGDGESSINLVCLRDTNPRELEIVCLEDVKSAEEAQSIKLMEKNNLKQLMLSWTEGAERFVDDKVLLEKLVPPKSLHRLVIIGYNGVSLPTWVCQQNSWLSINNCPKLRMGPLLPRAADQLEIIRSDNVLSSWGECTMSSTGASSSSSVLTTGTLKVDSELPMQQWRLFRHLSGLYHLEITTCPDLTVSPDIIPHLSSVKFLVINKSNISSLPHWFMDLTDLERLWIEGCEGIRSLPEGIQQLTKLCILEIHRCPDLKKWCASEENKMKLSHINVHFY